MTVALTNIGRKYGIGEILDGKESPETLESWIAKGKAARIAEEPETIRREADNGSPVENAGDPVLPAKKGSGKKKDRTEQDTDGMEIVHQPAPEIDIEEGIVRKPRKTAARGKTK